MLLIALRNSLRLSFAAALEELCPLALHTDDDQAAAVELTEELLQFFQRDLLGRELRLELVFDLVHARLAVEHLEDGELLLLEAIVVKSDRVLHYPIASSMVALAARERSGRLRILSRRAELESRLSERLTMNRRPETGSGTGRESLGLLVLRRR